VLARAGVASRRKSEELIRQGRVAVNGRVVRELGVRVDPAEDVITVDGRRLRLRGQHTYILLHKPPGVITTVHDPWGRPTVLDLVQVQARVYPVGRLDANSEGLVLLTDDGELAYRLAHPRFEHEKEYHVLVTGRPSARALERLRRGVRLEDGVTAPAQVEVLRRAGRDTWLRMILHEGRKRQIRRMAGAVGHPVKRLIRVRIGPLRLGNLAPGEWRHLTSQEVEVLREAVEVNRRSAGSQTTRNAGRKRKPRPPDDPGAMRS